VEQNFHPLEVIDLDLHTPYQERQQSESKCLSYHAIPICRLDTRETPVRPLFEDGQIPKRDDPVAPDSHLIALHGKDSTKEGPVAERSTVLILYMPTAEPLPETRLPLPKELGSSSSRCQPLYNVESLKSLDHRFLWRKPIRMTTLIPDKVHFNKYYFLGR